MDRVNRATAQAATHRIELDGEYDLTRKEELEALFDSLSADGPVTIDLTKVTYADSTFLRVLGHLYFRLQEHGATLVGANRGMRRLLSIVQFDRLFRVTDS